MSVHPSVHLSIGWYVSPTVGWSVGPSISLCHLCYWWRNGQKKTSHRSSLQWMLATEYNGSRISWARWGGAFWKPAFSMLVSTTLKPDYGRVGWEQRAVSLNFHTRMLKKEKQNRKKSSNFNKLGMDGGLMDGWTYKSDAVSFCISRGSMKIISSASLRASWNSSAPAA